MLSKRNGIDRLECAVEHSAVVDRLELASDLNGIDKCAHTSKDTSSYEGAYDFVAYDKPSRRGFYVWKYEPKVEKVCDSS